MPDKSKFGGVPVDEPAGGSKFGGVPVAEESNDHAVRDALKSEGFLDSAWAAIKSPITFVHSLYSGDYGSETQSQIKRAQELEKSGTPEQRREFAKEVLLKNIPFASTIYKAVNGNLEGAVGDVAGLAVLGGATKAAGKAIPAVAEIPGKVRAIAQDPLVRTQAGKLPGVSSVKKVVDFGKAAKQAVDIYQGKPIHPEIPVRPQPVGDAYANPTPPADPYAPKNLINREAPTITPQTVQEVPISAPQPAQVQSVAPTGSLPLPNVQGGGGPRRIAMPVSPEPNPPTSQIPPSIEGPKSAVRLTPREIAEQLQAEMIKNGTIPENGVIPGATPEFQAATYEALARASKVDALAKALHENGISYADARNMGLKEWELLSRATGERMPSQTSVEHILGTLKKLEKPAAPKAPLKVNRRKK